MYLLGLYKMILRVFHILEKYIRLRITEVLYSDTIERLIRQSFRISFLNNLGLYFEFCNNHHWYSRKILKRPSKKQVWKKMIPS